jgi:hypothetical protein
MDGKFLRRSGVPDVEYLGDALAIYLRPNRDGVAGRIPAFELGLLREEEVREVHELLDVVVEGECAGTEPQDDGTTIRQPPERTVAPTGTARVLMPFGQLLRMCSESAHRVCRMKATHHARIGTENLCQRSGFRRSSADVELRTLRNIPLHAPREGERRHEQRSLRPDQVLKESDEPGRTRTEVPEGTQRGMDQDHRATSNAQVLQHGPELTLAGPLEEHLVIQLFTVR